MDDHTIPLSMRTVYRRLIISGATAFLVYSITTFFFLRAVVFAPRLQGLLLIALWVGMLTLWVLDMFVTYQNRAKTKYILTSEALCIRKKGWFGRSSEDLYRYDTIVSVNSTSYAHGAYGSIKLTIHRHTPVVLSGVVTPEKYARYIKKLVNVARTIL